MYAPRGLEHRAPTRTDHWRPSCWVRSPAPPLLVSVLALVACVGVGAWLAFTLPVAAVAPTGAAIGAVLGAALVTLLLHDGGERPSAPARGRRLR